MLTVDVGRVFLWEGNCCCSLSGIDLAAVRCLYHLANGIKLSCLSINLYFITNHAIVYPQINVCFLNKKHSWIWWSNFRAHWCFTCCSQIINFSGCLNLACNFHIYHPFDKIIIITFFLSASASSDNLFLHVLMKKPNSRRITWHLFLLVRYNFLTDCYSNVDGLIMCLHACKINLIPGAQFIHPSVECFDDSRVWCQEKQGWEHDFQEKLVCLHRCGFKFIKSCFCGYFV